MLQKVTPNDYVETLFVRQDYKKGLSPEFSKYKRSEAISWIKSIISMENKIKTMRLEIASLKEDISISGVQYSDLPKNPNLTDDAIMNTVLMYEERCSTLNGLISEYTTKIHNAELILQCLSSHECAYTVIKLHYFQNKTYQEIAFKLGYSLDRIKQISADALIELYDLLPYGPGYKTPIPKAI